MKKFLVGLFILFLATNVFASQWENASSSYLDGDAVNFNDVDTDLTNYVIDPLDRILSNYQRGMVLVYNSASQITVNAGEVMVSNSSGTIRLMMNNTSNTTVTWADIDINAEEASTTYYIYAIAATIASETATFKISKSATSPDSVTYYKKIGSFYNDASRNISNISNVNERSVGAPVSKSIGTTYQALTDGFVESYASVDNGDRFQLLTDSSSAPTTVKQELETGSGTTAYRGSMGCFVRAGDYYKFNVVSGDVGVSGMYFTPISLNGGN